MSRIMIIAAAIAALTVPVAPAAANSFSLTLVPRGEAATALRTGLSIYGIVRDLKSRARIEQRGTGNGAAIAQSGQGNRAFLIQRGRDNAGTISQRGNYNTYGLVQIGRGNRTAVVQEGRGEVGLTIQGGW